MNQFYIEEFIKRALQEDIHTGDITSENIFTNETTTAKLIIKHDYCCLSGIDIAEQVFKTIDSSLNFKKYYNDGDIIKSGTIIAEISGKALSILLGERVMLNLLSFMSAISTNAYKYKLRLKEIRKKIIELNDNNLSKSFLLNRIDNFRLLDTRKTYPHYREFSKYSIRIGGLHNHRTGLYDAVMIKENHINAIGSIERAIKKIRENTSHMHKIEVETENYDDFLHAIENKADIIMLDEFSEEDLIKVSNYFKNNNKNCKIEISGFVNYESLENILITNPVPFDYISIGTDLTLNINPIDFSLKT